MAAFTKVGLTGNKRIVHEKGMRVRVWLCGGGIVDRLRENSENIAERRG